MAAGRAWRAAAAAIQVPTVDRLSARVVVDSSSICFSVRAIGGSDHRAAASHRLSNSLHSEWGLSLFLESQRADEQRKFMLDYGYSAPVLLNNIEVIGFDPGKLDALIMSHGHCDHLGGLMGFLNKHRKRMPADLTMYAGGEDNFCQRYTRTQGELERLRHARSPRPPPSGRRRCCVKRRP